MSSYTSSFCQKLSELLTRWPETIFFSNKSTYEKLKLPNSWTDIVLVCSTVWYCTSQFIRPPSLLTSNDKRLSNDNYFLHLSSFCNPVITLCMALWNISLLQVTTLQVGLLLLLYCTLDECGVSGAHFSTSEEIKAHSNEFLPKKQNLLTTTWSSRKKLTLSF